MTTVMSQHNARYISHRITAHRMRERGSSLDVIADHLHVSSRQVHRYLEKPCPEPLDAAPQVDLDEFYLKGSCTGFPEYDWVSDRPREQAECKAICAHCPVLQQCRTYGLTAGRENAGIWGGMTKYERDARVREAAGQPPLRRRSRRAVVGAA